MSFSGIIAMVLLTGLLPVFDSAPRSIGFTADSETGTVVTSRLLTPEAPQRIASDSRGVLVTAEAALVLDTETGVSLWEKNADEVRPIASITKLVTLGAAFEKPVALEEIVTITEGDYTSLGARTFSVGDTVSVRDLIAAILIASDNTAANALARVSAGSVGAFVSEMNAYAAANGFSTAHFTDPSGLSDTNVASARDVAGLAELVFENEFLRSLSRSAVSSIAINGESYTLRTTNRLLGSMISIISGKTGYVTESGYNVAGIAERNGIPLTVVILGSATNDDRFQDFKMLAHWTWENFAWKE